MKKTEAEFQTACAVEENQLGSLNGRWAASSFPIPLSVREGHFSGEEIAAIQSAVAVWNRFLLKTQSLKAFEFGTDEAPRITKQDKPVAPCNSTLLTTDGTGSFAKDIVIYKLGTWPHKQMPDAIAVTELCKNRTAKMLIASFYFGSIDVNYQNFFVEGKPQPDLFTNILHELGHVMGLEHSCKGGAGTADFVSCEDEGLPAEYSEAIMFPFDQSSVGVLKRKLKSNDQHRTNCLYGPSSYPVESTSTK